MAYGVGAKDACRLIRRCRRIVTSPLRKCGRLPLSVAAAGNSNQQPQDDPPEQVLVTIEKILRDISASGPPNAVGYDGSIIEAPIALCCRVINAIIWEENLWNLIRENMINVGSFDV